MISKAEKLLISADTYLQPGHYFDFCTKVLHRDLEEQPHREMCDVAEYQTDFFEEYFPTKTTPPEEVKNYFLSLTPRDSFKSTVFTECMTVKLITKFPNCRVLISSETSTKAKLFASAVMNHLEENEKYITLYGEQWPEKKDDFPWSSQRFNVRARTVVGLKENTVMTCGIGQSMPGLHFDFIISDDLVSDKNTTTKEQIQQTTDHVAYLQSLLAPYGVHSLIGTRWHYFDSYGEILDDPDKREEYNCYVRGATKKRKGKIVLYFPGRLTPAFLRKKAKLQGKYIFNCNPGEAPILMEDFTEKPICEVEVGDKVVGWETFEENGRRKRRMVKSEVLEINSRVAKTQTVFLDNGEKVRCTPDHKWYTGRSPNDPTHKEYRPAIVGSRMLKINCADMHSVCWYEGIEYDRGWLGGMFDGEGHCRKGGALWIHQCTEHNLPVYEKLVATAKRLEYDFKESAYKGQTTGIFMRGGAAIKRRFLLENKPSKGWQILASLYGNSARFVGQKPKVTKIVEEGEEEVFALTTSTGNYVAWNYLSKNCQYHNDPVSADDHAFDFKNYNLISKNDFKRIIIAQKNYFWFYMVDPALTEEKKRRGDYTAMSPYVITADEKIYLYRPKAVKEGEDTIAKTIYDHHKSVSKDLGKPYASYFEMLGFQKLLVKEMKMMERKSRHKIHWSNQKTETPTSKEIRIRSAIPFLEEGLLYLVEDTPRPGFHNLTGATAMLVDQAHRFPLCKNDDMLDNQGYIIDLMVIPMKAKGAAKKGKNFDNDWEDDDDPDETDYNSREDYPSI